MLSNEIIYSGSQLDEFSDRALLVFKNSVNKMNIVLEEGGDISPVLEKIKKYCQIVYALQDLEYDEYGLTGVNNLTPSMIANLVTFLY